MVFLRRFLSFILSVVALGLLLFCLAFWTARYWAVECEVSQVFKLSHSMALGSGTTLGSYNVAVTPLTAQDKMARICQLYTVTPAPYLDLLNKKVRLFLLMEYPFAYDETPQAHRLAFFPLGLGLLLLVLAYLLFQDKEGKNSG